MSNTWQITIQKNSAVPNGTPEQREIASTDAVLALIKSGRIKSVRRVKKSPA
jgi:hypothetical protein